MSSQQYCEYSDHKQLSIIGICVEQQCSSSRAYCNQCLKKNIHYTQIPYCPLKKLIFGGKARGHDNISKIAEILHHLNSIFRLSEKEINQKTIQNFNINQLDRLANDLSKIEHLSNFNNWKKTNEYLKTIIELFQKINKNSTAPSKYTRKQGHSYCVSSVCISPDGTTLASGTGNPFGLKGQDNSIRLWDIKSGEQKAKLDGHTDYVRSLSFTPDGNTLASGSGDNSIQLWDVKTGQQKAKLDGHSSGVNFVCFSPNCTILASGSYDNTIRLLDVKTRQQKAQLEGPAQTVWSICFSPDGNMIASGNGDNSIRFYITTKQQKAKLEGHSSGIGTISFSPDGTLLASGSDDNSIRLWDVKTKQQIAKLDGHTSTVYSICFSPQRYCISIWQQRQLYPFMGPLNRKMKLLFQ